MSEEESTFLLFAGIVALVSWGLWSHELRTLPPHLASTHTRRTLFFGPVLGAALLGLVLTTMASFDVVNSPTYVGFYLVLGLCWVGMFRFVPFGVSLRDDVLERDNRPAAHAWVGATIGLMACFAGANIGDGPGFECVLFAGFLATLGWWLTSAVVDATSALTETVTIDRDRAAGTRLASFYVAAGVLWGRGAAGDFVSYGQTIVDMVHAWPVLLLVAKVVLLERSFLRTTPSRPEGDLLAHGIVPAMIDVGLVLAGLVLAGPLPQGYEPRA